MKKVFFVCYGGGHSNIIDLIAKKLMLNTQVEIKILALTLAYPNLKDKYSSSIVKLSDYVSLFDENIDLILKHGINLIEGNYAKSSGISKHETLLYLGLSMYDLVSQYGKIKAMEMYSEKKRQSFLPVQTMKTILEYEKPDLIVSTTSPRFEQASFIAGNDLGIETLEILDLFGELYPLPEANHIVVMNNNVKNSLIEQGLVNKTYHILGQPVIEQTANNIKHINIETTQKKIYGLRNKKILSFFSQIPLTYNRDFSFNSFIEYDFYNEKIFKLFESLIKLCDVDILIRIHPNEDYFNYEKWINKFDNIYFTNEILTLEENIAISDVVLTHSSTVGVEALAANKKVFTFMHEYDISYPLPAAMQKPFIFSKSFDELLSKLVFEFDSNEKQNINNFIELNSTRKIHDLILKLI